ncbi:MAG: hypothetical protein PHI06_01325 [Desulfobulbaceae bacterium]|nr:hypothetical protein [Desulfobulbaceae bacterium]
MESIVQELKKVITFKETTVIGDLLLVAAEKSKSVFYALLTDIVRDDSRPEEWWHLTLQILSVPPQEVVWTLREPQFTGKEIFTMGGDGRFIKAVNFSKPEPLPEKRSPHQKTAGPRPLLKRVK